MAISPKARKGFGFLAEMIGLVPIDPPETPATPVADAIPAKGRGKRKAEPKGSAMPAVPAKPTAPSSEEQAERDRQSLDIIRAMEAAKKAKTFEALLSTAVDDVEAAANSVRSAAAWLNINLLPEIDRVPEIKGDHWSIILPHNVETAEAKLLAKRIDEYKQLSRKLTLALNASHSNKYVTWQRICEAGVIMHEGAGGETRENRPVARSYEAALKEVCIRIYKRGLREKRQTARICELQKALGDLLTSKFKVDLSEYNKKA